jgi:hypothetical protein
MELLHNVTLGGSDVIKITYPDYYSLLPMGLCGIQLHTDSVSRIMAVPRKSPIELKAAKRVATQKQQALRD